MYFVCCFFAYDWGDPAMESLGTEANRGEGSFFLFTFFPFYPFSFLPLYHFVFKDFSYASSRFSFLSCSILLRFCVYAYEKFVKIIS